MQFNQYSIYAMNSSATGAENGVSGLFHKLDNMEFTKIRDFLNEKYGLQEDFVKIDFPKTQESIEITPADNAINILLINLLDGSQEGRVYFCKKK